MHTSSAELENACLAKLKANKCIDMINKSIQLLISLAPGGRSIYKLTTNYQPGRL